MYIYIYIERERKKERERSKHACLDIVMISQEDSVAVVIDVMKSVVAHGPYFIKHKHGLR